MNNELLTQKNWWQRNWKWFTPVAVIIIFASGLFMISDMDKHLGDFAKASSDTELFKNAVEKAQQDPRVVELLGQLEPIENMAIIEGEVQYTNNDQAVELSVRILGSKGKARLDISAEWINESWEYQKINIRIKTPPEKKTNSSNSP